MIDVILSYIMKTFGDLFLVAGIGFPSALMILRDNRYYILRLVLAAAVLSGLFIYLVFMITTNIVTLTITDFRIMFAVIFLIPLAFRRTRVNLVQLVKRFSFAQNFGFFAIVTLTLVLTILFSTLIVAIQSTPILDDPLTVWLFLGKQIYLTGKIPVYFGNAADISESGNYPPMAAFVASSVFFLFHNLDVSNYTLIPWYYGALGIAGIVYLVKELGGSTEAALLGAVITLVTTIYSLEMFGWGYTDTLDAFYVIAFLGFILSKSGPSVESAIFALLAITDAVESKYDVLLILAPSLLIFLYLRHDIIMLIKNRVLVLALSSGIIATMSSWFVRNWLILGDPVYPFLDTLFKAKGIVLAVKDLMPASTTPVPPFSPAFLLNDGTFTGLTNEGNLWPILVFGFAGIICFILFREKFITALSFWSLTSFIIVFAYWELSGGFERYLIIVVPSMAAISGLLFDRIAKWQISQTVRKIDISRVMRYAMLIFILVLSFSSLTALFFPQPAVQDNSFVQSWTFVNNLPRGLVATNDIRRFYSDQPIVAFFNIPNLFNASTLYGTFLALRNSNISYIYFNTRFDYSVYVSHTFLVQMLANSTYVTPLETFDSGQISIYRVN